MSIIIIASDSYKTGREISEKVAEAAGYAFMDRELLKSVSEKYNAPEGKLIRALEKPPSFMGLTSKLRNLYLAYIQEVTLSRLLEDNVVCHGLAAHLYILGVSHALKVRILSDPERLISEMTAQENVARKKAINLIKKRKALRKRWSIACFNMDENEPSGYDLVISLSQIEPDEAVKTVVDTVGYRKFKPMTYSIKCLKDKELAGRVRAVLMKNFSDVKVQANGSTVIVETRALKRDKQKKTEAIKKLAGEIKDVGLVEVHVFKDIFRQAVESDR
jgi:Cytidylate kinase-like family